MTTPDTQALKEAAEKANRESVPLPYDLEKWLITIKAHCTAINDYLTDAAAIETVQCLRLNVDRDLRPAILSLISDYERMKAENEAMRAALDGHKVSPHALYDISVEFGISYEALMEKFGHMRNAAKAIKGE